MINDVISPSSLAPHHLLLCRPNPNLHLNKANASPPPLISSSLFFVSKKSGGRGRSGGGAGGPSESGRIFDFGGSSHEVAAYYPAS